MEQEATLITHLQTVIVVAHHKHGFSSLSVFLLASTSSTEISLNTQFSLLFIPCLIKEPLPSSGHTNSPIWWAMLLNGILFKIYVQLTSKTCGFCLLVPSLRCFSPFTNRVWNGALGRIVRNYWVEVQTLSLSTGETWQLHTPRSCGHFPAHLCLSSRWKLTEHFARVRHHSLLDPVSIYVY